MRRSASLRFPIAVLAAVLCAATVTACSPAPATKPGAAAAVTGINGVWVSRNKALPDGIAAGFPLDLSSTDWIPLSQGSPETLTIESYESQKAAVEKVIAANGDVFAHERSRHKPPPFTDAGLQAVAQAQAARSAPGTKRDPYAQCLPRNSIGIAAPGGFGGGVEIFTTPDHVGIVAEDGSFKVVRTGAADASKFTPTYNGVSVGRWNGKALVVTTTNFLGDTGNNWPMSAQAKVTDEVTPSDDGKSLHIKTTYEDPENLKEPVARMTYLDRAPADYEFLPANCVETVQGAAAYAETFGSAPPK